MRRLNYMAAGFATAVVGLATVYLLTAADTAPHAGPTSAAAVPGTGPLDGLTFVGMLGPEGRPGDVPDSLRFENGLFVSAECERRCNYPSRPYYVREEGGRMSFISETRCPDKDAKIIWRGSVENGVLKGRSTWTVNRWYWSIEKTFWFEGKLATGT